MLIVNHYLILKILTKKFLATGWLNPKTFSWKLIIVFLLEKATYNRKLIKIDIKI